MAFAIRDGLGIGALPLWTALPWLRDGTLIRVPPVRRRATPAPRAWLATCEALFGLLAASGMRISEALNLERSDVMLEQLMLRVRNSKFKKSRLIHFMQRQSQLLNVTSASVTIRFRSQQITIFSSDCGCALKIWNADDAFSTLRRRLGWVARGDH